MAHRYYWLKLSSDFFYGEESKPYINRLRAECKSLGDTYIVIFIKMMLYSLNTEGVIRYKGIFQTFEEELADALSEETVNVKNTLSFFLKTPFLEEYYENENSEKMLFIPYVTKNTGSKTDSALRMEKAREKLKLEAEKSKLLETSQCAHNVTPRFKENKSFKDINLKSPSQSDASKKAYGCNRNVYLSDDEYAYLCNTYCNPGKILDDVSYWIKGKNANPGNYFELIKKFISNDKDKYTRLDDPKRLAALENLRRVEEAFEKEHSKELEEYRLRKSRDETSQKTDGDIAGLDNILSTCQSLLNKGGIK